MSINCVALVGPLLDFDNLRMKYSRPQKPFVSSLRGLEALRIQFPSANEKIRLQKTLFVYGVCMTKVTWSRRERSSLALVLHRYFKM